MIAVSFLKTEAAMLHKYVCIIIITKRKKSEKFELFDEFLVLTRENHYKGTFFIVESLCGFPACALLSRPI